MERALFPISQTVPAILMLDGTTKPPVIVQHEPMMEVAPDFLKAEAAMVSTESGSAKVVRQPAKA
jgi:hypothetical protein